MLEWVGNYVSLEMTREQALSASHQGSCDDAVEELLKNEDIKKQLVAMNDEDLRKELRDYGAWSPEELAVVYDNWARIVWIAACDLRERE